MMSILEQLPAVRGSYTSNEPMSKHTWFGVGGPADIIFNPIDEDDLVHFLTGCPHEIPLLLLGLDQTCWFVMVELRVWLSSLALI